METKKVVLKADSRVDLRGGHLDERRAVRWAAMMVFGWAERWAVPKEMLWADEWAESRVVCWESLMVDSMAVLKAVRSAVQ